MEYDYNDIVRYIRYFRGLYNDIVRYIRYSEILFMRNFTVAVG